MASPAHIAEAALDVISASSSKRLNGFGSMNSIQTFTRKQDGYTWNQNESLADLIKPERIRQIKLDIIKRQKENRTNNRGTTLVDILGDDIMCTNCFI